MSKNLVIVESPTKAETIGKFLGKDYLVLSSRGHIRDIENEGKHSIGIDFNNGYAPHYVIDEQKKHLISTLRLEVKKADKVWLASDEDREGEAIAWHLQQVLELPENDKNRIVFHEITKTAIQEAIAHPRAIDYNLVNAQQARRVVDRIVGYELSPVLWRKVTSGLSAGRVQSVAVRLIVEREREIESFDTSAQYRVTADFTGKSQEGKTVTLHTELNHRFATRQEAEIFLQNCISANFSISSITHKPTKRTPAPPFTTSTLQQEAARKLHFTPSRTMRLAQALYEAGHITYMRTDSVNLSTLALGTAKEAILSTFGADYHKARQYHTSTKGAQEAHEAIRPTFIATEQAGATAEQRRLYELIRKRTLASQMADAQIDNTRIEVTAQGMSYIFVATGEVVVFDGFMRAYVQDTDEEKEDSKALPPMNDGTGLNTKMIQARMSFTKPPMRYTEASLVKRLEELGIGRPSTYATITDTIQQRQYVKKGDIAGKTREVDVITLKGGAIAGETQTETYGQDKDKLLPTDLGQLTNDFLVASFPEIMSYDFTAKEEEQFDHVAEGNADWVQTVDTFYKTFHPAIERIPKGKMEARLLGNDPETGEPVFAKVSRVGPCIQIGTAEGDKPRFASLEQGQSIFSITLEEALRLFHKQPQGPLMQLDGKDVVTGKGRFGPYIRYDGKFYSVPKGKDAATMTETEIRALIEQKEKRNEPIHEWGDMQVLRGRFGPYLKDSTGNYRLPKGVDAEALTEEECRQIIASSQPTNKATNKKRS
ncbi:MAG: type I DNA topoisomerase [Paludibacteraceae bacterium]|nr:type I DNA topoisomerase [Paludibacteraceae bacterium]